VPDSIDTIAAFLDVVRKSGLIDDARLEEAVAAWPDQAAALPGELVQALIDQNLLTPWQADQLRKGRHKGFMLGKYRLLKLLGAGGMSSVYLAENTTLRGKVAIKVLPRKFTDQTSYLARFEREAQIAWRLSHPNIVRAFDLEQAGNIHYIPMEYVDGIDLHAKVKQDGPLSVEQAVDYVRQAALGLQHAHEEGLVHRDIKPANLILEKKGSERKEVVKILDLGLASAKSDEGSLTEEHNEKVLGTADYLAPEQAKNSHGADARSDIYALGCTLYYLLVAAPPFPSGTLSERIRAHTQTPPPNLLEKRPDVPPAIADLYFRMMAKNPQARPQSAGEIAEQLAAWLKTTPSGADAARPALPRRSLPRRSLGRGPGSGLAGAAGERPQSGTSPISGTGPVAISSRGPGSDPGVSASLTPPPSSPSRTTLPLPQPPRRVAGSRRGPGSGLGPESGLGPKTASEFAFNTGATPPAGGAKTGSVKAGGTGAAKPAAESTAPVKGPSRWKAVSDRLAIAPLGLPLVYWIAALVGLVLVGVLAAYFLMTSQREPGGDAGGARDQTPNQQAPDSEGDAVAEETPATTPPKASTPPKPADKKALPANLGKSETKPAAKVQSTAPPAAETGGGFLDAALKTKPAEEAAPAAK
jgi:serine/threonine protein kinase